MKLPHRVDLFSWTTKHPIDDKLYLSKKNSSMFSSFLKNYKRVFLSTYYQRTSRQQGKQNESWRILYWKLMLCPLLGDLKCLNSTSIDCFVCASGCDTYFERAYWELKEVILWKIFTVWELLGKCSPVLYDFVFILIGALCASRNSGCAVFQNLIALQKSLIS